MSLQEALDGLKQAVLRDMPQDRFLRALVNWRGGASASRVTAELAGGAPDYQSLVTGAFRKATEATQLVKLLLYIGCQDPPPAVDAALQSVTEQIGEAVYAQDDGELIPVGTWTGVLPELERRICALEIDGRHQGTGFLVGVNLVLTAAHTVFVDGLVSADTPPQAIGDQSARLKVRFDYTVRPGTDGEPEPQTGNVEEVAQNWLVHSSDAHPSERLGDYPPDDPPLRNYDYALVRLAKEVGKQGVAGGARGWIALNKGTPPLRAMDKVFIFQHAAGQAQGFAYGFVGPIPAHEARLRYRVKTYPGSSGSPCCNSRLDLVALHNFGKSTGWNQGIPIQRITGDLNTTEAWAELDQDAPPRPPVAARPVPRFERTWEAGGRYPILGRKRLQESVFEMLEPGGAQILQVSGNHGGVAFTTRIIEQINRKFSLDLCIIEVSVETMRRGPGAVTQDLNDQLRLDMPFPEARPPLVNTFDEGVEQLRVFLGEVTQKVRSEGTGRQVWLIVSGADMDGTQRPEGTEPPTAVPLDSRKLVKELLLRTSRTPPLRVVLLLAGQAWISPVGGCLDEEVAGPTIADVEAHLQFAAERAGRSISAAAITSLAVEAVAPLPDGGRKTYQEIADGVERMVRALENLEGASPVAAEPLAQASQNVH